MDFFGLQDQAKQSTRKLVFLFFLAVGVIILALYIATVHFFIPPEGFEAPIERNILKSINHINLKPPEGMSLQDWLLYREWWYPKLFLSLALIITAIVLGGTLYKTGQLNRGGRTIATMLGGRAILPDIADGDERRLLNVVEEMAIASGTPPPAVYVLDREPGINAFAAGLTQKDMVLGVTKGCLLLLSRDELQGVIAHEFSHILRGDMRLNMRLMGTVFGITMISMIGYFILRFTATGFRFRGGKAISGRKKGKGGGGLGGGVLVLGILLYVLGYLGVFFGNLIKSAIARQREFLADASAVQFTRNPSGLAGALKKIGGLSQGSRILSPNGHEASHFYFSNGLRKSFLGILSTHPPLSQRILRLDPSFNGEYPSIEAPEFEPPEKEVPVGRSPGAPASPSILKLDTPEVRPEQFTATIGVLTADQIDYAADLRKMLPEPLHEALKTTPGASAAIMSLLLSGDEATRSIQMETIREDSHPAVLEEFTRLAPIVSALETGMRIPLVDWAIPALRNLSDTQYEAFEKLIEKLIASDRRVDLFEFCLQRMLRRYLSAHFRQGTPPAVKHFKTEDVLPEALHLLSALAWSGHASEQDATQAFFEGARQLNLSRRHDFAPPPKSRADDLPQIDRTLERLSLAAPYVKKNLLFACAHTAASDGALLEPERELLRAIADSLDLPVPPFIRELVHSPLNTA